MPVLLNDPLAPFNMKLNLLKDNSSANCLLSLFRSLSLYLTLTTGTLTKAFASFVYLTDHKLKNLEGGNLISYPYGWKITSKPHIVPVYFIVFKL